MKIPLCRRCPLLAALLAAMTPALGGAIDLEWNPVTGATSYRIYYGAASGQYSASMDVGNVTQATVANLANCTTWYLAVKSLSSSGESAEFSNEVFGWPRPEINPAGAMQGSQGVVDVTGANFEPGASLEIDNPNVAVQSVTVLGCNQLQAALAIDPPAAGQRAAEVGTWDVTMTNPPDASGDSIFGTRASGFEVLIDPARQDVNRSVAFTIDRLDGLDFPMITTHFPAGQPTCSCCHESCPAFDFDLDINGDGWIDGEDLAFVTGAFFSSCWDVSIGDWFAAACASHPSQSP